MKQKTLNPKLKEILTDIVYLCISGLLFAIAYNMFFVPGAIFIGGAGGIATALNILFNIPTGTMIILINVPLVALFMLFYGAKSAVKGIVGILVSSLFVDGTAMLGIFGEAFPNAAENRLLCAILGGLVLGAAVAFMFARGYSTGGSDLIAFLVKIFIPNASTPNVIFGVEACVVLIASLITNDTISTIVMSIFFSIICTFMQTNALSTINGGFDKTRVAYIFSDKYEELADAMMKDLKRGEIGRAHV